MAGSDRHIDDILTRLVSLQSSFRKLYEELMPLQRENMSLQKENMVLKKKMDTLHNHLVQMKKTVEEEKHVIQKDPGNISNLYEINTLREDFSKLTTRGEEDRIHKRKVTDLSERVRSLEKKSDKVSTSLVDVSINTSTGKLTTRKDMKLDKCYREYLNLGSFNTTSCCLQPKTKGRYVVFVKFCQTHAGRIRVSLLGDDDFSDYMGKTVQDKDVVTGVTVITIKSIPYNLWVEAMRGEGNAVISWCNVTSWKLCDV